MSEDKHTSLPDQRAFFNLYPLSGNDQLDIAAAAGVARQTVGGWVNGHNRINRNVFVTHFLPMLRKRYPNIDEDLVQGMIENASPRNLRRTVQYRPPTSAPVQLHPTVVPTAEPTPVADVFAALTTFPSLRIMLAGAQLTPSERLQLIRILTGEEE